MKQSKYISIPKPCHENWNGMLPQERGRFCLSCEKKVTDFTGMQDYEIIHFFKLHGNTCGRFTIEQLKRPYDFHEAKPKPPLFNALIFSLINFFGIQANSQVKNDSGKIIPAIETPVHTDTQYEDTEINEVIIKDSTITDTIAVASPQDTLGPVLEYYISIPANQEIFITMGFTSISSFPTNPDLCFCITPPDFIPEIKDRIPEHATFERNRAELLSAENEKEKLPPVKLLFQWLGSIPVYRILKKRIRIK